MAYKLVIVESPAKAKTIEKYLGGTYKVEASQGHIRDLPKSQLGVDIEDDFEPRYITIRGRGPILEKIRKDAKGAQKVFLATDPDREGEAISWHLAQVLGIPEKAVCRVDFNEITSKTVKAAIKKPRAINMDLVAAQQARRVLDRLVGYKISPLLWAKVRKGLSAGRVQSVACSMIVAREEEINEFIPKEYWPVSGRFRAGKEHLDAKCVRFGDMEAPFASQEETEQLRAACEGKTFTAGSVKRGTRTVAPVAPFTTSSLQQEASRKLNFTTQKTMQIAQQLYEGVEIKGEGLQGLVSYIRTDSTRVSDEALSAVRELIGSTYGKEYLPEKANVYTGRRNIQDAHEAIRPTDVMRTPESVATSLTKDQLKLYRLIYMRFVASQMESAVYDTIQAELVSDSVAFRYSGQHLRFAGFRAVYVEGQDDTEEEKDSRLSNIEDGMTFSLQEIRTEQHFTQAPPRYTEASLVRALEEKGIGRPSTYAPTITTILARGYILRENKRLIPTELGIVVTDLMEQYFPDIVGIAFTADMEDQLDKVEEGTKEWKEILRTFYPEFDRELSAAEGSIEKVEIEDEVSDVPCEKCGAMMVIKNGRFGKFLACPNFPECRTTKTIPTFVDAVCPECGGRILEKKSKRGRRFFGCENYPECSYVSWDMPVRDKCPKCGSNMVLKRGRKGEMFNMCVNPECNERVPVEAEAQETDNE